MRRNLALNVTPELISALHGHVVFELYCIFKSKNKIQSLERTNENPDSVLSKTSYVKPWIDR